MVHVLLKPSLETFEHYFTSVWDECDCVVVWALFGIAFLWDWNENWPFPVLWPLLSFPNLLAYWVHHFHSIIFQDWNSSTGTPSSPLALFIVMLPKAHLTSHSKMSSSRWVRVITPSWLSGSWRSFLYRFSVYSCHLFLTSSASVRPGNGKPLQYSCLENPMNSMKRQKDTTLRDEFPRSVGTQYATGDQWRNNSRKNEGMATIFMEGIFQIFQGQC